MKRIVIHRGQLVREDGVTLPVKLIGKGSFARAYLGADNTVYLTIKDGSGDYAKEILANIEPHRHIPLTEEVGFTPDSRVYRQLLYKAPLRKGDSPKAWAQYRAIKKCWETARDSTKRRPGHSHGHEIAYKTVECAYEVGVPDDLAEALELLAGNMANYGADWTFEFSPRNLATDPNGDLILLDVMFSMEAMARKWKGR